MQWRVKLPLCCSNWHSGHTMFSPDLHWLASFLVSSKNFSLKAIQAFLLSFVASTDPSPCLSSYPFLVILEARGLRGQYFK